MVEPRLLSRDPGRSDQHAAPGTDASVRGRSAEVVAQAAEGELGLEVLDVAGDAGRDRLVELHPAGHGALLHRRAVAVERALGARVGDLDRREPDLLRDDAGGREAAGAEEK